MRPGILTAVVVVVLLCAMGVFAHGAFEDARLQKRSREVCERSGLGEWKAILETYAQQRAGALPSAAEREELAAKHIAALLRSALLCDTGAPYVWNSGVTRMNTGKRTPLAWCGQPHGYVSKWRNVLFSDLRLRRVSESEFQRLPGTY
jgi:hypothetical protein